MRLPITHYRYTPNRIETFLSENFLPSLESVSISEFDSYKEGIISRLLEPDQRLTSQAGRWSTLPPVTHYVLARRSLSAHSANFSTSCMLYSITQLTLILSPPCHTYPNKILARDHILFNPRLKQWLRV